LLDMKSFCAALGGAPGAPGKTVTVLARSCGRSRRGGVGYMELNLLFGISSIGADTFPDGNIVFELSRYTEVPWPG
jgi:hypothetical protein